MYKNLKPLDRISRIDKIIHLLPFLSLWIVCFHGFFRKPGNKEKIRIILLILSDKNSLISYFVYALSAIKFG
ncbi:MAG: hypothetical protein AVO38_15780 [delta proteobacterium ML8_D]|nr:MAG: hypothetical protein AVO38_15780 [delta proteobacterium ML8_D]